MALVATALIVSVLPTSPLKVINQMRSITIRFNLGSGNLFVRRALCHIGMDDDNDNIANRQASRNKNLWPQFNYSILLVCASVRARFGRD